MNARRLLTRLRRLEPAAIVTRTWIVTVIQKNERGEVTTHPIDKIVWTSGKQKGLGGSR